MPFWNSSQFRGSARAVIIVTLILGCGITFVSAADESYVGYLGDAILLQGQSYSGTQVYMFMTGPGLPENGVTLTDVTQRADQGHFTIVPLDNNQHFSFKWDTWLIHKEIDPGTYIVYIVNEPVDKAHLGSPSSYQTLSAYLKKDPYISQGSVSIGTSYTLNPELHTSTVSATPVPVNTTAVPTTTLVTTMVPAQSPTTAAPTTRAPVHPVTPAIAVVCLIGAIRFWRYHL